jgi:acetyl-CoA synthetase
MTGALSDLLHEERRFPPPPEFAARGDVGAEAHAEAAADRAAFWAEQARPLTWAQEWEPGRASSRS